MKKTELERFRKCCLGLHRSRRFDAAFHRRVGHVNHLILLTRAENRRQRRATSLNHRRRSRGRDAKRRIPKSS